MNEKKNTAVKDNRRYKYGSLSAIFTIVFIALILVINLVFSSLSLSGDLTVDLTQEEFTTVHEESETILTELGKDLDITIYFMSARDQYELSANEYNGINLTAIVRDLAENYAKIFDGSGEKGIVRVEYKELDKDPDFEKKYLEESTTRLTATSVIVQGKHHFRVLDLSAFFNFDEDGNYYSFNGEYRFTAAMLQSSIAESPVVSLTYGNGEPIGADGRLTTESDIFGMVSVLSGAGFEIKTVNLESDDIDPRTEILITYDPVTDLTISEIDKISDYLAVRNSYIVFVDSATPKLSNLQDMLETNWGMNYKPNYRVTDTTHSLGESSIINAKYPTISSDLQSTSASYQILRTVSETEGNFTTALPESVALFKRNSLTEDEFSVETVLTAYETASASAVGATDTITGEIPLMLVSSVYEYNTDGVAEFSYVTLVGSTEFADTDRLTSESYGNKRLLLAAARIFSTNRVAPDVQAITFGSVALEIETGTARTLSWLICTILPAVIMVMGLVVFFKRRHL